MPSSTPSAPRLSRFYARLFALVHTVVIVIVFSLSLLFPGSDSGAVGVLSTVVLYLIDHPIGLLAEAMRPELPDFWVRFTVFLALYLFVGGALWYAVGLVTAWVSRRLATGGRFR